MTTIHQATHQTETPGLLIREETFVRQTLTGRETGRERRYVVVEADTLYGASDIPESATLDEALTRARGIAEWRCSQGITWDGERWLQPSEVAPAYAALRTTLEHEYPLLVAAERHLERCMRGRAHARTVERTEHELAQRRRRYEAGVARKALLSRALRGAS